MKVVRFLLIFAIGPAICASMSIAMPAYPEQAQAKQNTSTLPHPAFASVAEPEGHVTILILDMSTSMNGNDPGGLRCSAAKAYIDLSNANDKIGIIGLTNTDSATADDSYHFLSAEIWRQPVPVGVLSQREALENVITQRPPGEPDCQVPYGSTPLYDALDQARKMLAQATSDPGGNLSGSVVLMTDGQPFPNQQKQADAVLNDLRPIFLKHHWPIDVVALNAVGSYLNFLRMLADGTGGRFYQTTEGNADAQPSPLSIASFFTTIFALRVGRTLDMGAVHTLSGETQSLNFGLDDYARHLDLVVIKDQGISAKLTTPQGDTLPSPDPPPHALLIAGDPYYEIFSFDGPSAGVWQLDVRGSGQFQVASLVTSWLQISILSPAPNAPVQPLDRPFTLAAQVVDGRTGEAIPGQRFVLVSTVKYEGEPPGGTRAFATRVILSDRGGTYQTSVSPPPYAAPGTYTATFAVSRDTDAVISSASRTLRLVHFPVPLLIAPQTGLPATKPIRLELMRWHPLLQALYGADSPLGGWPGQLALLHHPVQPQATLTGQIRLDQGASAHVMVTRAVLHGAKNLTLPIGVKTMPAGRFQLILPSLSDGAYTIALTPGGTFEDRSGDLGTTTYTLLIGSAPVSSDLNLFAWIITAVYALVVLLLIVFGLYIHWRRSGPAPFGECLLDRGGGNLYHYPFTRSQHSLLSYLCWRNTLYSEQVRAVKTPGAAGAPSDSWSHLPSGLKIRFYRDHTIKVSPRRGRRQVKAWRRKEGNTEEDLKKGFHEERELIYSLGGQTPLSHITYIIDPR
jgi:hypothetical protein